MYHPVPNTRRLTLCLIGPSACGKTTFARHACECLHTDRPPPPTIGCIRYTSPSLHVWDVGSRIICNGFELSLTDVDLYVLMYDDRDRAQAWVDYCLRRGIAFHEVVSHRTAADLEQALSYSSGGSEALSTHHVVPTDRSAVHAVVSSLEACVPRTSPVTLWDRCVRWLGMSHKSTDVA